MDKSKVTIVGAGIAGLSLALILANHGIPVTIVEKRTLPNRKDLKPSARTTALMHGSLEVLEKAGAWPDFKEHCTRLVQLSIIDDSVYPRGMGDMVREDFRAEELSLSEFGYNVPLFSMAVHLSEMVQSHKNITVLDNVEITKNDDVIQGADLIVGADGRHSSVREWSGITATEKQYDQMAITCIISHTQSHNNTSVEFHRSGGPFTLVPFGENQSAVVWVEKNREAKNFLRLSRDEIVNALQDRTRGLLGRIDMIVPPESWPLITLKADKLTASKTVLIAEAAHVLSPIGAQGLNLSLRDIAVLSDLVIKAFDQGEDIASPKLLLAYEQNRRKDIIPRHFGVHMLHQAVANNNVLMRGVRRFGLRFVRFASPVRKLLMEQGLSPKS